MKIGPVLSWKQKISLRPYDCKDIPLRVRWLNFYDSNNSTTEKEQAEWFARYETDPTKKFFTICRDDNPIGVAGLSRIGLKGGRAEVFILIGEPENRNQGYGKTALKQIMAYAFDKLGLKKLALEVDKSNVPAIKLYQDAGFNKVGENDREFLMELIKS